jgi:hypothetical protein
MKSRMNADKEISEQTNKSHETAHTTPPLAIGNIPVEGLPAMCNRIIVRNEGCSHDYITETVACTARMVGLCKKTQDRIRIDPKWICNGCLSALRRAVESMSNKSGMSNGIRIDMLY